VGEFLVKRNVDHFSVTHFNAGCLPLVLLYLLTSDMGASAQVPPITPSGLNTQVSGPIAVGAQTQYNITGGTRPGGGTNLFHSFGNFNVPNNNIANFLNETGLPTSNILGRVTGGNLSSIFGTIQTTGFGNANLFLMNPAGFLFGPNATVNVGGMVAFTSADYLRLSDGVRFNAVPDAAADALLSPAPVAAFGFLGSNPGAITVQGSQFAVTEGTGISLVGGNITIESGTPEGGTAQHAQLIAPNGKIQLATARSPGEFDAATLQALPNVDGASFTSFGSVSLASGSNINISGANTVSIRGGQFVLSVNDAVLSTATSTGPAETISLSRGSSIVTSNSGPDPGADIQIIGSDVNMDGASIQSLTTGEGSGGNISVTDAQTLTFTNGAQIVSSTSGEGDGGNINLSTTDTPASSVTISGFDSEGTLSGVAPFGIVTSGLFTTASSTGNGGNISIATRAVTLENAGTGTTITSGDGHGGNLTITATTMDIGSGGTLMSFNGFDLTTGELVGTGQGGNIAITAADSVKMSGFNPDLFFLSSIFSQAANTAKAGDIAITAPTVILDAGANIGSFGSGEAPAGSISITAIDSLSISGVNPFGSPSTIGTITDFAEGGAMNIRAGSVAISDHGVIQTGSFGSGNPGNITLQVDQNLNITGGGIIASFGGAISSGNISVSADTVTVSGMSEFSRSRIEIMNGGDGATGKILINAREITVTDNARINSEGANGTGNISISATESLTVSDGAKIRMVNESGPGGLVEISAPTIMMQQGVVQSETIGSGDAGSITIHADNLTLDGSFINGRTLAGLGRGGDVTIVVAKGLSITGRFNGTEADLARPAGIYTDTGATSDFGTGAAGNILVTASEVQLSEGANISSNTFGQGDAGNLTVKANLINMQSGAQITSGSLQRAPFFEGEEVPVPTGHAGTITIQGLSGPAESVVIQGQDSGLFTETRGTGLGGAITVNANAVTMTNGATISAESLGAADAGSINITATNGLSMQNSFITTQADGGAGGGNIKITTSPQATVYLQNSEINASVADGPGGGGNISIDPQYVILQNSNILARAEGQGGAITITTNLFLPDATSAVNADSGSGLNGTVTIQSPFSQAGGRIQPLGKSPLLSTSLFNQRCAALTGGNYSSFTLAGRDTVPAEPGGWLSTPLALGSLSQDKSLEATSERATPLLSLRQIAPSGFLTQVFAVESSGCES
jgi:filamentous hemagglutinin family protein